MCILRKERKSLVSGKAVKCTVYSPDLKHGWSAMWYVTVGTSHSGASWMDVHSALHLTRDWKNMWTITSSYNNYQIRDPPSPEKTHPQKCGRREGVEKVAHLVVRVFKIQYIWNTVVELWTSSLWESSDDKS